MDDQDLRDIWELQADQRDRRDLEDVRRDREFLALQQIAATGRWQREEGVAQMSTVCEATRCETCQMLNLNVTSGSRFLLYSK